MVARGKEKGHTLSDITSMVPVGECGTVVVLAYSDLLRSQDILGAAIGQLMGVRATMKQLWRGRAAIGRTALEAEAAMGQLSPGKKLS